MFSSNIFRANDIRGRWKQDFNLDFTKNLSVALKKLCENKGLLEAKILLAEDARLSSPALSQSLKQNLKAQGFAVASIGLAPSPLCYFLLHYHNLTACIVVTASHNPKEYNGFKILFHRKYKIFDPIQQLKNYCLQKTSLTKQLSKTRGYEFSVLKEKPYLASLKKEFPLLKAPPFVIDAGNGALGPLAKQVFSDLGLKAECLFCEPDGGFPNHHPDPTVEKNLIHLKQKIVETKSFLGFGFDGDGDRLVLVNEKGQSILGDEFGFLFFNTLFKASQKQKRKALILADVKCSDWFFTKSKKQGLEAIMTQSGHGLIRAQMERTKALMAVEFSGHLFFNDRKGRGFDDALYASLRLLELLHKTQKSLDSLLPKISSVKTPEIRMDMSPSDISQKISKIQAYLLERGESFKKIDGIRLSRNKSWALFRSSKTQPALTMRFEAPDQKQLDQMKKEFSKVMACPIP